MTAALVDNDVILKVSAYQLGHALIKSTTIKGVPPAMLAVGRYVIRDRIKRSGRFVDKPAIAAAFESLSTAIDLLEPSADEMHFAAELEQAATKLNLELDTGESQLVAILLNRGSPALLTGDKRAIKAIGLVVGESIGGRLACLEQLMVHIVQELGADMPRAAVSKEPSTDKAMTICFQCTRESTPNLNEVFEALQSYIEDLRAKASGALLIGQNLSALAF